MEKSYALVNAAGLVTNVIIWDGESPYTPPPGEAAVPVPPGTAVGPGWIYSGGQFRAPAAPAPSAAQLAQTAILAGCAIVSAGTPAVNGVYATAGQAWEDMKDEAQFVSTFNAFSTSTGTFPWLLPDGKTSIVFPSPAAFLAVVKALGQYLTAVKQFGLGQAAAPAQPVNIA